jgi:iron complex outermembrane receptor protein
MTIKKQHAQPHKFKYSLIASAIIGLSPSFVSAEEAEDKVKKEASIEVIEVTGQRGNLISAQNMKMNADTVMDALSAADLGSMPDRSVLEAISRMPGVAIERFAAADDPDHFGVEGGGVVVRGLTHVRSEFNGRDSFSADSGRGLSFEDVSPELMGSVELFKNQTADMIEGGIAGTVNLVTRKPFDADGRVIAFSTDATYTDLREETSPTFSALYSDIWETDSGRFGVLVNYSQAEVKVESDGIQVGRYQPQNRDANLFVPESTRLSKKLDDRERQGFAASLQWESSDKTLLLTGEYIRSEATLAWSENVMEMDDGARNDLVPVEGTEFEFDENGFFEQGIITSEAGWRGNDADRQPGGTYGMQHNMQTRMRDEESIVNDYSFNAKFTPNDTWSFEYDIQYIDATKEILDFSVMGGMRAVVGMDLTGGGVPNITLHGADYDGQADYVEGTPFTDPSNSFFRSAMDHIADNEGTEFATAFDTEYTFDDGVLSSVEFGVRYSEREQTTRQSTYNWGLLSEAWSGEGNQWYDEAPEGLYEEVSFDNFVRGGQLSMEGGNAFLFPSRDMVTDYANVTSNFADVNVGGWSPLADRDGTTGSFVGNEINVTEETSQAAYIKFNFDGELAGLEYSANLGLRYIKLENDTKGFITYPDDAPDAENPTDAMHFLDPAQAAFGNAASTALVASSEYTNVLPSVNFKLHLTDELLLRVGFSEAVALPSLGNLRNYVGIGGQDLTIILDPENVDENGQPIPVSASYDRYTASSGNPYLKPMESYNYDLSLEWYFAEAGSLTASLFYKDLSNYFINGVTVRDYTNNGVTQPVEVAGATNGDKGTIAGYEIAYQQFFDTLPGAWSGLGVQLNYTHINEDGSPNAGLRDSASDNTAAGDFAFEGLPLEGLSEENANVAVLYEKFAISARIAYNWRSEYLLTTRDVITTLPIYNTANGQLDASLFWAIDDNWNVGIQGTNLNNNVTETLMQINEAGDKQTRSWFTNDRRYSLVVKATF